MFETTNTGQHNQWTSKSVIQLKFTIFQKPQTLIDVGAIEAYMCAKFNRQRCQKGVRFPT